MTAEDPRIVASDVDQENAGGVPYETDNQEETILLAQADGDPVPVPDGPGDGDGGNPVVPSEIVPDASNVVRLPAGVTIEELRVDGADIVLVQADGSEIRIVNAALNIPTFVIDDIEVPREVLLAVLQDNGINVAAGPEGQLAVVGPAPQGSGGNFDDQFGDGEGGGGPGVLGLLGDTQQGGGGTTGEENLDGSGVAPTISAGGDTGTLVESDDVPGGTDAEPTPATGTISFFDPDFGETRTAEVTTSTLVASNIFHGPTLTQPQIDALLAGFSLDSAATGGITTEPSAAGNGTIDWTYTVPNALIDFLAAGETIVLDFEVTISDGINSVSTTVQITVVGTNDIPVFAAADTMVIDEEILTDGNDGDSYPGGSDVDPNAAPPFGGSLGITWGPDDYSDNAQTIVNGDVTFTNVVTWSSGAPLTSRGDAITTTVSDGGATITGTADGRTVFIATVDEQGNGTYTFELQDVLDHPGADAEDDVSLTFGLNVADSNGFAQAHEFTVTVNDDAPVIGGAAANGVVEEEEGSVAGAGIEDSDGSGDDDVAALGIVFDNPTTNQLTDVDLNISWGADNANTDPDGGASDGNGDRGLAFSNASAVANVVVNGGALDPATLTSRGDLITYTLDNDSGTLVASANGRTVFTVSLSDQGSGSYSFTLEDTIEHPEGDGENTLTFTFSFTATDSDGDGTEADFSVEVIDDVPVALGSILPRYVEEEQLTGGNEDTTPGVITGDLDYDLGFFGSDYTLTTQQVSASLNIFWGGDDSNTDVNGGFDGTQVDGDRSVVFADIADAVANITLTDGSGNPLDPAALTSDGLTVEYELLANNTVLRAFTSAGTVFTVTLSDEDFGSYDFVLGATLDHPAGGSENELRFTFDFTARDGDGDPVSADFEVRVLDDTPVQGSADNSSVDEDNLPTGNVDSGYPGDITGSAATSGGSLGIAWGTDDNLRDESAADTFGRSVAFVRNGGSSGSANPIGAGAVTAAQIGLPGSLTSDGTALAYQIVETIGANGTWDGGYQLIGYKAGGDFNSAADQVFKLTLDPTTSEGTYSFELIGNLDHPTSGTEDNHDLNFAFRAVDADGDVGARASFRVRVDDDAPVVNGAAANGIVEEEENDVAGAGIEDSDGSGDDDFVVVVPIINPTTQQVTDVDLNIDWGADDSNSDEDGGASDGNGDRGLAFTEASAVANVIVNGGAIDPATLTSRGDTITYALSNDGGTLIASANGRTVFTVSLSDQGSGSYSFVLEDTIEHPEGGGENTLTFTFAFTATDSDGDGADSSFSVEVIDDKPGAIGTILTRYVEEEALTDGNPDTQPTGAEAAGFIANGFQPVSGSAGGPLNIFWGGDDSNTAADGGFDGTQAAGDRSVIFDVANPASTSGGPRVLTDAEINAFLSVAGPLAASDLTSGGVALVYELSADNSVLTATANGNVVFTVTLSDTGSGSYQFDLTGTLDHPDNDNGAANEDTLELSFDFVARDGDGDTTGGGFTVAVIDDAPITTAAVSNFQVDEDGLPGGNVGESYVSGDYATGGARDAATVASRSLNIAWGADNLDDATDGASGDTLLQDAPGGDGDRSVVFRTNTLNQLPDLTSGGADVHYVLNADGTILLAHKGAPGTDFASVNAADMVFRVSLSDEASGSYSFELLGKLDHPTAGDEDNIVLDFNFRAFDSDGDHVNGSFRVRVDDDAPVQTGDGNHNAGLDEDDVAAIANVQPAGTDGSGPTQATGNINKVDFGADGFGSLAFSGAFAVPNENSGTLTAGGPGIDSGLTSDNDPVLFRLSADGLTIEGYVAGRLPGGGDEVILQASLNGTDRGYTVDLFGNIDHQPGSTGRGAGQSINFDVRATDGDDDFIDVNLSVRITDDAPVQTGDGNHNAGLDEDDVAAIANVQPAGTDGSGPTQATGNISKVDFGADGFGSLAFSGAFAVPNENSGTLTAGGPGIDSGLTSDNDPVLFRLSADGLTIEGYVAGRLPGGGDEVVLQASLNGTDRGYTVDLFGNIDHQPGSTGRGAGQSINFDVRATDGDDDFIDVNLSVRITDDAPSTPDVNAAMDENDTTVVTLIDGTDFSFGADGDGGVVLGAASVTDGPAGVTLGLPGIAFSGGDTITITPGTAFDALVEGETAILHIPYTAIDGEGDESTGEVLVTVTGTNDGPLITVPGGETTSTTIPGHTGDTVVTRGLTETDAALTTSGQLTVSDVDVTDVVSAEVVSIDGGGSGYNVASALGFLTVNPADPAAVLDSTETTDTLAWNFDSGAETFDFLPNGFQVRLNYTIRVTDSEGATDDQVVSILITGTNDAPVITGGDVAGTVVETGLIAGVDGADGSGDLEPGAALLASVTTDLSVLETDGSQLETVYADVLAEVGDPAQAIAVIWDYLDDNYVNGGPTQDPINEAFIRLGVVYAQYLQEGGQPLTDVAAKFTADDNDLNTTPERLQSLHDNLLGNTTSSAIAQRFGGEPLEGTLTALVNGVDPALLSRPYFSGNEGASDAAVRAWDAANGYAAPTVSGQLTAMDPDAGQTALLTWSGDAAGAYGSFSIDANTGEWTYVLDDSAADALAVGETATEIFPVVVSDPSGATDTVDVTITVTGTNDAPVIDASSSLEFVRGFDGAGDSIIDSTSGGYGSVNLVADGTGGINTEDGSGFALLGEVSGVGPFTRFDGYRSDWSGDWTAEVKVYLDTGWADGSGFDYSVAASGSDGAHQRDFIFHVTKDTSSGELLVAGSNNTNFAPREDLETINHHTVTTSGWYTLQHRFYEDGGVLKVDLNLVDDGGNILWTETRTNAADTIPGEVGGNRYGWFTFIDVPGGLGVDGISLNMAGTETVVSEFSEGHPDEGTGGHTTSGEVPFGDVDISDAHSVSVTSDTTGFVGTFTPSILDASTGDGEGTIGWTFTVDDADIEHLGVGDTLSQTYTVEVDDGNGGTDTIDVTVTISGTNDAPEITGGIVGSAVAESGAIAGIDDAGLGGGLQSALVFATDLSVLTTDGSQLETVFAAVEAELGDAAQAIAAIWDYLDDNYVNGGPTQDPINEAFIRLGAKYAELVKDGTITPFVDVMAKFTADDGDANSTPERAQNLHDNLLGNTTASAIAQRFGGEPLEATLTALVSGVDPALLTRPYFSGNEGASDAAVRSWDFDNGYVPMATGQLTATDLDLGETATLVWSGDAAGTYGSFSIDPNTGEWTYKLDNSLPATQALTAGQVQNEVFTVTVEDIHGATDTIDVTVTVTGANDAPVIEGDVAGSVIETGNPLGIESAEVSGNLEPDASVLASVSTDMSVLETDGSQLEQVYADVLAELGGDAAQAIAVIWDYLDDNYVNGGPNQDPINQAFVRLGVVYAEYLQGGGAPLTDILAKFTADDGDANTTPERAQSLHDNLLGNLIGSVIDGRFPPGLATTLKNLVSGVDAEFLTRPYFSGNEGASDAAVRAWDAANGYAAPTVSGQLTATDIDAGETASLAWAAGATAGTYGTFSIDASGGWSYVLDDSAADALGAGETQTETFTATVTDVNGAVDTATVTITVVGTNDAPHALALSGTDIPAGAGAGFRVGEVTVSDVDDNDGFTFDVSIPGFTVVTENIGGVDHFFLETTAPVTSLPPSLGITVTDGDGASFSASFVVTLPVQLFAPDGTTLLGSYSTIQAAVDDAATDNHIVVGAGTYNESVQVDVAVKFSAPAGATVTPPSGSAFTLTGDLGAGNTVSFDGFNFADAPESGIKAGAGVTLGLLEVANSSFEGNYRNGIEINGAAIGDTHVTDSTFTDNGGRETGDPVQTSSGDGDILFFQYGGDATLQNLTLTNGGQGVAPAENGIQFRGDGIPMGDVVMDNVTISGSYEKQPIGIFNYSDIGGSTDGLQMTDVTVNADSTTYQTSINIDGIGGDIDFSDPVKFDNVTIGAPDPVSLQGNGNAQSITGDDGGEFIRGFGGDDTLRGNGGDDLVLGFDRTGAADSDVDTAEFSGSFGDYTITFTTNDIGFGPIPGLEISGPDGNDFLGQVEILSFDGDANDVLIVGSGGFDSLEEAVAAANSGDTILIADGAHNLTAAGSATPGQLVIDKDLNIIGQGQGVSSILAVADTGTSGDARGMFLVEPGVTLNVSSLTVDGNGHLIYQGFRHQGSGTFDDVEFTDIQYNASGPTYAGTAIAVFGGGPGQDVDVTNSSFSEIGRVGVLYFGADVTGNFEGNTYTGKGAGDWLDYALDISAGAGITVRDNVISDNLGVASSDGSSSAGILVTTFFGGGTNAVIGNNTFTDNSQGVAIGYNDTDTSDVTFEAGNTFSGGNGGVQVVGNAVVNGIELIGGPNGTVNWDGGAAVNLIGGADLDDTLEGDGGADVIEGRGGDDTITWRVGDGNDQIDGGSNTATGDTLVVESTAAGQTITLTAPGDGGDGFTVSDGTDTADVDNVEEVVVDFSAGSGTLNIVGDFAASGININTITVEGGDTGDTVDASAMTGTDPASRVGIDFNGNGGDDTFVSGTGDDHFIGGAGTDSHEFGGDLANYTVVLNPDGSATITDNVGDDGVDTSDATVERLVFDDVTLDLTMAVRLFDASDDSLIGTFDTVDDAVNAVAGQGASDLRIEVDGSLYGATESLDIAGADINGKNVTIVGDGAVTIGEATGDAVTLTGDFGGGSLTFENVTIDGGHNGITANGTVTNLAELKLDGVTVSGNANHGLFLFETRDGIAQLTIDGGSFAGNGVFDNNTAHIKLFGFSGDADFIGGLTLDGTANAPAYGIEIIGGTQGGNANPVPANEPAIGDVTFDGVALTGSFAKNAVALFNFLNLNGLDIQGLDLSGAETGWGPLFNIDGVASSYDASGYNITYPSGGTGHAALPADGIVAELQGDKTGQDPVNNTITGSDANERLIGKAGNDTLIGGGGDDELFGHFKNGTDEPGNDTLIGGAGNDRMFGGSGDDTFVLITSNFDNGLDHYDGGAGYDRIVGGWSIDVLNVTNNLSNLVSIEEIDGASNTGHNTILATAGDDTLDFSGIVVKQFIIDGAGGNDTITGTNANDTIRGGAGNDTLNGLGGDDTFLLVTSNFDNGLDQYDGGAGYDRIVGGWSIDVLNVTNNLANLVGIEELEGGDTTLDRNTILATAGNDTLNFSSLVVNNFTIDGGAGNDIITGTSAGDRIRGGADNDTITGGAGNDTMFGNDGNDTFVLITSNFDNGLDHYDGGAGYDRIVGGWSIDVLNVTNNLSNLVSIEELDGAGSSNTILATAGNDMLDFSAIVVKNFVIDGGAGDDTITGTSANDTIRGGADNDTLNGLGGDDTFLLTTGGDLSGIDQYDGGSGYDRIVGGWSIDVLHVTNNLANLVGIEAVDGGDGTVDRNTILATAGNDTLDFSGLAVTRFTIDGGAGEDTITGTAAADRIRGGADNDTVNGGAGDDTIFGNDGDDTLIGGGQPDSTADRLVGNAGNDTLYGNETDLSSAANKFAQTGENDIASYAGSASDYAVTWNAGLEAWQVTRTTGGGEGAGSVDTLYGIEGIDFGNNGTVDVDLRLPVQLFDDAGTLLGTFELIQDAIDAAGSVAGHATVRIAAGTYEELLSIDNENLTLIGEGDATVIVAPPGTIPTTITVGASSTPNKSAIVTVEDSTVTIQGIKIDGQGRGDDKAGNDYNGIVMIDSGGAVDDVTITGIRAPLDGNGQVSGQQWGVGFYVFNTDGTPRTLAFTNNTVEDFQKNATVFAGSGLDVDVSGNTITGNSGTPTTAQNGLQFSAGVTGTVDNNTVEEIGWFWSGAGTQWASSAILSNGADVDITNNTVTGPSNAPTPPQQLSAAGIYVISDPDGSVLQSNTVEGFTWGIISYLDGAQPTIGGNSFAGDELNLGFYGPAVGVTVAGSDGADEFDGGPGDDTFSGQGGDDMFYWSAGGGRDVIDGGTEDTADTFSATGQAGVAETFTVYSQAEAITQIGYGGTAEIVITRGADIIAELSEIEEIVIDGQGGGDTFAVEGSFAGTSLATSTITFTGGAGADTFDLSGLASGHRVVVNGGAGIDQVNFNNITFASVEGSGVEGIYEDGDLVGVAITTGGATHELRGIENFQFSDGLKSFTEVLNIPEAGQIGLYDAGDNLLSTHATLSDAVTAASNGHTIKIGEGSFSLGSSMLVINKEISIVGQSETDTTVEAAATSYGIHVTSDNVAIRNLTLDASAVTHYGLKVNPANSSPNTENLTNFLAENVTVHGAGRSEIDLNGVDNSTLRNVTADGQGTGGVGIALSDSTGITLENIETSDNNWGSIGLYSKGAVWEAGTNDITFLGTYSHTEGTGIYADEENGSSVENVDFSGIFSEVYVVRNDSFRTDLGHDNRSDDFTFFFGSEADAIAFALNPEGSLASAGNSVITGPFAPGDVDAELGTPLSGGATFVVSEGMSIQEAIDKASDGDTILVRAGTYDESLLIDKQVTIISADGPGAATIAGTLNTNPPYDGSPLDEFFEANNPSYTGTRGIEIRTDNVTLDGFTVTGFGVGVELDGASMAGVSIVNNTFTDNVTGIRKSMAAEVTDITISGNTFSHGVHGMTIYAASNGAGAFDGVTIDGNSFSDLSEKGMYFEQLSGASLTANSFDGVGNFGRISPPFGGTQGEFGNAIDINLKYGTYQDVTFTGTVIVNSGNSNLNGAGEPGDFGAAIAVKIRDDGPSYSGNPADFTGQIVFTGGSIDGTSTGVRVGEPGKDNNGPDVLLDGVLIRNAGVTDVENATDPATGGLTTVVMHPDQGTLDGSASQAPLDVTGSDNADTIIGGSAADTMAGGDGNDIYFADGADTVIEAVGEGTDEVRTTDSFVLGDNVENLTLLDGASNLENFEDFDLGPIANGENGWKYAGTSDQEIVDQGGNKMLRMSSDPTSGAFGGPYSPALPQSAGEPQTTAAFSGMQVSFTFAAVQLADQSRLEVDFGNADGTDRNNFMVLENTASGIRIAVADPLLDGNWDTGAGVNDFTPFTGNRTLVDGVDASVAHQLTMTVEYKDGPDNDVISFYLDGEHIGSSTTFENYRDVLGGTHADNAEDNQTSRLFFRNSGPGTPQDGPGGDNQGFVFDDINYSVYDVDGPSGTGNGLDNTITGNSGNNELFGLAGNDTLIGGLGDDILSGGEGLNTLTGDEGADTFVIDPSALSEVAMVDVITDYNKDEGDVVDLGNLLQAALGSAPADGTEADAAVNLVVNGANTDVVVDENGSDPGGEIVVAQLTGVHTAINILYDGSSDTEVS